MTVEWWLLLARVAITMALLAIVMVLILVSPLDGDHPLAEIIVGAILGYWMGHAEVATVSATMGKHDGN